MFMGRTAFILHQKVPCSDIFCAGSDSGGGAGIQADLKTFAALGVFGTSAITAVTSQNTRGVNGIHEVPAEVVSKQICSVLDDMSVHVVKIGMLPNVEASFHTQLASGEVLVDGSKANVSRILPADDE